MTIDGQLHSLSLREQALSVLRERLVSGELKAGEIYSASALATELGVSNSPVREAMLTLVQQGFMETVRNRGFRVVPLSETDRHNVYDIRMMLEVPATGRLIEVREKVRAREQEFREIAASIVTSATGGDVVSYLEADRQFHLGLLGLLDNPQLSAIIDKLRDQTRLYGLRALADSGRLVSSAEEHGPILDAILQKDAAVVEELMTEHLQHIPAEWR